MKPGAHSHAASDVLPGPDTACEGHAAHSPEASTEFLYVSAGHGAHTGGSCAPVLHDTAVLPAAPAAEYAYCSNRTRIERTVD